MPAHVLDRVQDGGFREDLYYRLNGLEVALPALRERSDKSQLLDFLLSEEAGDEVVQIAEPARQALLAFAWPGNVRQLRNVLRTLAALCEDGCIGLDDLPAMIRQARPQVCNAPPLTDFPLDDAERLALLNAWLEERPVLVFDEWAADQDPAFRRVFYTELLPDLKRLGKTIIVISHRPIAIDRIRPISPRRSLVMVWIVVRF